MFDALADEVDIPLLVAVLVSVESDAGVQICIAHVLRYLAAMHGMRVSEGRQFWWWCRNHLHVAYAVDRCREAIVAAGGVPALHALLDSVRPDARDIAAETLLELSHGAA